MDAVGSSKLMGWLLKKRAWSPRTFDKALNPFFIRASFEFSSHPNFVGKSIVLIPSSSGQCFKRGFPAKTSQTSTRLNPFF
ncbi:MAG: hypothetical protein WBQ93_11620, partial [Candidatus Competibacter sp.]